MLPIYNLGIRFYILIVRIASLFSKKASLFVSGRKIVFDELTEFSNTNNAPVVWFHAASLGEFEQGLPVMQEYKLRFPEDKILVTFFSPSGYEERKNHPIADLVCYLPIDTRRNANRFIALIKPKKVFFIKYEYWFHYLKAIKSKNIQLYSISALFTLKHIFFKPHGGFHRKMLGFFDHTFVQNKPSLELLRSIGIKEASVSGDTRFDRVLKTIENPNHYPEIQLFKRGEKLCIIGSAWPSDMRILNSFVNNAPDDLKFVIAPHIIEQAHINKIASGINKNIHEYSKGKQIPKNTEVLILDTMGMLSSVYQYGDFAYIGGAFGDGLHNILEAVAFGLPVVYGNKGLEKFPESLELQELGGGFIVESEKEVNSILSKLLDNETFRSETSDICKKFISQNSGATDVIMSYLKGEEK